MDVSKQKSALTFVRIIHAVLLVYHHLLLLSKDMFKLLFFLLDIQLAYAKRITFDMMTCSIIKARFM